MLPKLTRTVPVAERLSDYDRYSITYSLGNSGPESVTCFYAGHAIAESDAVSYARAAACPSARPAW